MQDLVLLQTFLGLSVAAGVVAGGSLINRTCSISQRKFQISMQYLCQGSLSLLSLSLLVLGLVVEYRNLCLLAWTYGLGLGSFRYSLKMLALERIRAKHFTKAWGFIKTAEALPVLFGIPLVSFLNEASSSSAAQGQPPHILQHGRAGYFICSAATVIASVLLFFIGHPERRYNQQQCTGTATSCNGSLISHYTGPVSGSACPDLLNRSFNSSSRYNNGGGYSASIYPIQSQTPVHSHQQQQALPPAYNHHHTTTEPNCHHRMNGGVGTGGAAAGEGGVAPRLQKSLSFAFQTPPVMWNGQDHRHHHYPQTIHQQQQHQQVVNGAGGCLYSRCSSR